MTWQIRPDNPRADKHGKPRKYETPYSARNRLAIHPHSRGAVGNPKVKAIFTEGVRKRDAAISHGLFAMALTGVNNWRGRNDAGGKVALPDFHDVALNGRRVYLAWDSDAWENPGVYDALADFREWLKSRDADVRIIYLPTLDGGEKCGLDDFFAAGHSADELWALASTELRPPPERERQATPAAPKWSGPTPKAGDVLDAVREFIGRYIVMGGTQHDAVALWVAHTHAFDVAGSTPYLAVNSAEPESGKTQLLEVLEAIVARPWLTGRVTAAALIRKVDRDRPSLLLDESDAAFKGAPEYAEALRGVLNTGYRASGRATVCVGQGADLTVRDFATFCPKAIAGLGRLPDTVQTRSIPVAMKRRRADEPVSAWLSSAPPADAENLRAKLAAWADGHARKLGKATPARPNGLGDRAYDVWRPLLAIADAAGGTADEDWPARARAAAATLSGKGADRPTSYGVALLEKLRALFASRDPLMSADAVDALNADDELPFGAWHDGAGITARDLSRLLKPYGVRPRTVRPPGAGKTARGYHAKDCADPFARYLPPPSDTSDTTTAPSQKTAESIRHTKPVVSDSREAANPHGARVVSDVSDKRPGEAAYEGDDAQASLFNGRPASAIDPDVIAGHGWSARSDDANDPEGGDA